MAPRVNASKRAAPKTATDAGTSKKQKQAIPSDDEEGEEEDDMNGSAKIQALLKEFAVSKARNTSGQVKAASRRIDALFAGVDEQMTALISTRLAAVDKSTARASDVRGGERKSALDYAHFLKVSQEQNELEDQVLEELDKTKSLLQAKATVWADELDTFKEAPKRVKKALKKFSKSVHAHAAESNELQELNLSSGLLVVKHLKGAVRGATAF